HSPRLHAAAGADHQNMGCLRRLFSEEQHYHSVEVVQPRYIVACVDRVGGGSGRTGEVSVLVLHHDTPPKAPIWSAPPATNSTLSNGGRSSAKAGVCRSSMTERRARAR